MLWWGGIGRLSGILPYKGLRYEELEIIVVENWTWAPAKQGGVMNWSKVPVEALRIQEKAEEQNNMLSPGCGGLGPKPWHVLRSWWAGLDLKMPGARS
jgi:hypothetical protein